MMRRTMALVVLGCAATASAQSFLIDFNDLARGELLGDQYFGSLGVKFIPNAFTGPNNNNTTEPWATNTRLTLANALDYFNLGTLGSPSLVSGLWVRTTDDWNSENGDASVEVTFGRPVLGATVDFAGIAFFEEGARDTQLIALGPNDEVLDIARAVGGFSVSQQRLSVYHPGGFTRLALLPGNYNDYVAFDNVAAVQPHQWIGPAGGAWADAGNWLGGVPTAGSTASLVSSGSTPLAITTPPGLDRLGAITFSGSADIVLTGDVMVTLESSELPEAVWAVRDIDVSLGLTPAFTSPGRIDVAGESTLTLSSTVGKASARTGVPVTKSGAGVVTGSFDFGPLAIEQGTWRLGPGISYASELAMAEEATMDVALGMLGLTDSPGVAYLESLLDAGRLTSSAISIEPRLVIGVSDVASMSATFAGESLRDPGAYALATLPGDANLDRVVGFADLLALAQWYGTSESSLWSRGDFDRDDEVGFGDLLLLAQYYGLGVAPDGSVGPAEAVGSFDHEWAMAQSLVPEPGIITLLACGAAGLVRRRGAIS